MLSVLKFEDEHVYGGRMNMYMVGVSEIYMYIDRWGYLSFCLAACSPLDVGGVCLVHAMSQCGLLDASTFAVTCGSSSFFRCRVSIYLKNHCRLCSRRLASGL